ncbi:hypothetical protein ACWD01_18180 [Streptomyces sp. NPDC002835]
MTVNQLPADVRAFARYFNELLTRLDRGGGWYEIFAQRDPDGMRACCQGVEIPPWDVVESLLQDLPGADAAEFRRAAALYAAAAAAHDRLPGGRETLEERAELMRHERLRAQARVEELLRHLAASPDEPRLVNELAWTRDDHSRAVRRQSELESRATSLAHPPPSDRPRTRPSGDLLPGRPLGAAQTEAPQAGWTPSHDRPGSPHAGRGPDEVGSPGPAPAPQAGWAPVHDRPGAAAPAPRAGQGQPLGPASAQAPPAGGTPDDVGPPDPGPAPHAGWAPARDRPGAAAPAPRAGQGQSLGAAQAEAPQAVWTPDGDVGSPGPGQAPQATSRPGQGRPRGPARHAGSRPGPGEAQGHGGNGAASAESSGPQWPAAPQGFGETSPPAPAAPPAPQGFGKGRGGGESPGERDSRPAPARKSKKRPRGGARFAGVEGGGEEAVAVPVLPVAGAAGDAPRGARYGGGTAATGPVHEPPPAPDEGAARAARETVAALGRLRAMGRGGEAHALICEAAARPTAWLPALADELHRSGLAADWATLLWEAASQPALRLAAAADALVAAGRGDDGRQLLRQGVYRSADEIADAALTLEADGTPHRAHSLLAAFVQVRAPADTAAVAAGDPARLVPLLLDAARAASPARQRDVVHALRVAGHIHS